MSEATIENYLNDKAMGVNGVGRRGSASTIRAYKHQLMNAEKLAGKPLHKITREDVPDIFRKLELEGLSDRTYNLMLTSCRNFMKWALYNDLDVSMRDNYFMDVTNLTIQPNDNPYLINEETFHKLCETIVRLEQEKKESVLETGPNSVNFGWRNRDFATKYVLILSLMFYGGCRISEAIGLKKNAVEDNGIRVLGKGDKERFVPLPHWLLENVKQYIETHKYGPFVFYGETGRSFRTKKDQPLSTMSLYSAFAAARKELGLPEEFTPHNLRHSFGTHALRSTKRLEIVQDLLGHSNPATTRIYARVLKDDLLEEYKKIYG